MKKSVFMLMAGIILAISSFCDLFAQDVHNCKVFSEYKNWAITIKPLLYQKAKITREYGEIELRSKQLYSGNIGIEYYFFPQNSFSFWTGLHIGYEPGYHFEYFVEEKDLFPQFDNGSFHSDIKYTIESFSIPFVLEYKRKAEEKIFFNVGSGLRVMYFPNGEISTTVTYANFDNTQQRQVFSMYAVSPENRFHYSIYLSSGLYFTFEKWLLKLNVLYNKRLQNLLEGEYRFDNMFVSPPTGGKYMLSGDFFGVSAAIFFNKRPDD